MNPDIPLVASAAAALLAPYTPYLVEGAKGAVKSFAESAGKAAFEKAKSLWETIQAKRKEDPKIKGAALILSTDPQDESAKKLLANAIAEQLDRDPELTHQVIDLLGQEKGVQEIIADEGSWVEDVLQDATTGGSQKIEAKHGSVISSVKQIKRS